MSKVVDREEIVCKGCGRRPEEINEYIESAKDSGTNPTDYVIEEEGTFNIMTGKFYCTQCYIRAGMPLGKA